MVYGGGAFGCCSSDDGSSCRGDVQCGGMAVLLAVAAVVMVMLLAAGW